MVPIRFCSVHEELGQQGDANQHRRDQPENDLRIQHALFLQILEDPTCDPVNDYRTQAPLDQHKRVRLRSTLKKNLGDGCQHAEREHSHGHPVQGIWKEFYPFVPYNHDGRILKNIAMNVQEWHRPDEGARETRHLLAPGK